MASTAFQTQYLTEFVAVFEQHQSLLRSAVTTEVMKEPNGGNAVVFLVAGSGGATAVTRGVNGLIPARNDDNTQVTLTLTEWHDLVQKTRYNIFASQGRQRAIMQMTTLAVMNRKIDDIIIAQLDTATVDTGAGVTASIGGVMKAWAILGNAFVPVEEEDNMFGLVTPGFMAYLMQTPEFASADYVDVKPFTGPVRKFRRWAGINWIVHPRLTGVGTTAEKCYIFHRSAIGHAVDSETIQSPVGYNEEQDYSYARATAYMGAKLLQNTGVVQIIHDGSALVGT